MKTQAPTRKAERGTRKSDWLRLRRSKFGVGCSALSSAFALAAFAAEPSAPSGTTLVPHDPGVFRPDPVYPADGYDADAQLKIYGDKRAVPTARPLLELGREMYREGPFQPGLDFLGKKNLVFANLLVSGDWRSAAAWNDFGNDELGVLATRLNLDVDLKLTATERIHAFFRPLDEDGRFTRYEFGNGREHGKLELDGHVDALFFEGDLGAIGAGFSGRDSSFDLPFTFGLIPLLFQNGVWMEDAFVGAAFSLPAKNSPLFDWSNFDVTFFGGFDKLTSPAFVDAGGLSDDDVGIFGVTTFIEANQGYWEAGYAYLHDSRSGPVDASYHNLTVGFTRRYFDRISNSLRVIGNFGQDDQPGGRTANGVIFLVENSLVTSLPSTLVPYANFFVGIDRPQSAARDAGAGGMLKNTGILFETDGLTGFPTLDASANDTYGGAIGVQYLLNLDQQIVFEAATVQVMGSDAGRNAAGAQYGLGFRYQLPLNHAWVFRADGMVGWREDDSDVAGVRMEIRRKF